MIDLVIGHHRAECVADPELFLSRLDELIEKATPLRGGQGGAGQSAREPYAERYPA